MKQISIHIPDTHVPFMLELLQKFDFVKIDTPLVDKDFVLTKTQKALVDIERAKCKDNPDYVLDWDEVKGTLKID